MNSEDLREKYNKRFESRFNNWSKTKRQVKAKHVKKVLKATGLEAKKFSLFDIGSALGDFCEEFRLQGGNVLGIDYSEVAISKAQENFPNCKFVHMDGFFPSLEGKFDIIFCRGFSGANTHDLGFVSRWINRYNSYLVKGGYFILSYFLTLAEGKGRRNGELDIRGSRKIKQIN